MVSIILNVRKTFPSSYILGNLLWHRVLASLYSGKMEWALIDIYAYVPP